MSKDTDPFFHSDAIIEGAAWFGQGTKIWANAHIMPGVKIGEYCSVGYGAEIGTDSTIGDHTRISFGVFLPNRSRIGSHVFLGPNATFTDDWYPRSENHDYHAEPPIVEDGASIGANATILPGVRIGAGAIIGAGAVVLSDVLAGDTVVGVPAHSTHKEESATSA